MGDIAEYLGAELEVGREDMPMVTEEQRNKEQGKQGVTGRVSEIKSTIVLCDVPQGI